MSLAARREFTVADLRPYDTRSAWRWIVAHLLRYKFRLFGGFGLDLVSMTLYTTAPLFIGRAAEVITQGQGVEALIYPALMVFACLGGDGVFALASRVALENLAQRLEVDARQELYASLLGKSQTYHNRQRVGDLMARATDDVRNLNPMVSPALIFVYETVLGIVIPLIYIGAIRLELLIAPLLFIAAYIMAVKGYTATLEPVMRSQREAYGKLNAGLEETISGIEIVKASAQEAYERGKFRDHADLYRRFFVAQGKIEGRYLPLLLFAVAFGATFLHAVLLFRAGVLSVASVIAVMGLMNTLRYPTFISLFSFSMIQMGVSSAERILKVIREETEMDENAGGHAATVRGEIAFEDVSFGHEGKGYGIEHVSFRVEPGQTVAIVGQTGSGKSTLAQLVNRVYDVDEGHILIDGVDAREWDMNALRSQIGKIEQDVFLFSRSVADNIAFGAPDSTQAQIERAAHEAQAHDFIMSFKEGYQTMIGERGVTLSGGQRQRIALARAFLSNPRILILDDSTSAIDSATEDEIQKAIQRARQGRTTLLITHRLSQIRWADHIIVLDQGHVVAGGSHEDLLRKSPQYRRIFARYEVSLPPLEEERMG